jgi:hypothetical protein
MSDPKPVAKKEEKKEEGGAHGLSLDPRKIAKVAIWIIFVILVVLAGVYITFLNTETAQNFTYFLYGLEIFLGIYIAYNLYTLWGFMHRFDHHVHSLHKLFATRYKPKEKKTDTLSPLEKRFLKAKEHIASNFKEEWKIGIIELDTLLKDLLKQNNLVGETVGELLLDAEKKNIKRVSNAWSAHKVRNRIVHEGIKFELNQDLTQRALKDYITIFEDLGFKH